ncbi:MAG: (d)CMP kinase [Myxococcota bacterium]|nr:(d)CMP kinase [Myxococcota bacterium]
MSGIQIAIDGPSASGKGTVSREVAKTLSYVYLDSGALYRTVALLAARVGIEWTDGGRLADLIAQTRFEVRSNGAAMDVLVNGESVGDAIRTESVGQGASAVAKLEEVRAALLSLQRKLASTGGVVMDGRDIGTVVLPHAELKVFLTASVDVRAERRHAEQLSRGIESSIMDVRQALEKRDEQDANREHAPLCEADDAIRVDSTHRSPAEVVAEIVGLARQRNA